jgi:hypothetical protein
VARKILTRDQAETAKKRAAPFLRNVLQDEDRADEVESESLDDWAEETGRTITNPAKRKPTMAQNGVTKGDLQDTLDQVGDMIVNALDPSLTREDVIQKLQEMDDLVNGDDDEIDVDDDDDSDDDDDPLTD